MKAALDYGRLGWTVIPIEPRGKQPLIRWQAYQYRRTDAPEIAEWFTRWPDANLAVVTGIVSGLVVLNLNPGPGTDASLERLQGEHGHLAETVEAITGGGGRHLYFAHPGEIIPKSVGIAPGIDLRGDGGYVVAPPSIHACGESYRWEHSPEMSRLAPLPGWLLRSSPDDQTHLEHSSDYWRRLLQEGITGEARNNTIVSLAEHLLCHDVAPDVTAELLLSWNAARCQPPLDVDEVRHRIESIVRLHQRGDDGDA